MRRRISSPRRLSALICVAASIGYAESTPPGDYAGVGKLVLVPENEVRLENGRSAPHVVLVDQADFRALGKFQGKWVRMKYTQTNTSGWGELPEIRDITVDVLHDDKNPPPLDVQVAPAARSLKFGEVFSFSCRFINSSERRVTFEFGHAFPFLKAKDDRGYEVALRAASNRPGYPGLWFPEDALDPRAELRESMTCTNLIMPGKYDFIIESPAVDGIRMLSQPIEIEVVSPNDEATEKTLLEWMDKATFAQQKGIAWILWRDFANHAGMKKLAEIVDRQETPDVVAAGILVASEGEAAVDPFLRAIQKVRDGSEIHYWCEKACQSPEPLVLFNRLLRLNTRIRYEEAGDAAVPLSHLVAHFLMYYWDGSQRFTWKESEEQRAKVVADLRRIMSATPATIRLFDGRSKFDPASIDGWIRRTFYWGE
jgi:hypothetical protein